MDYHARFLRRHAVQVVLVLRRMPPVKTRRDKPLAMRADADG